MNCLSVKSVCCSPLSILLSTIALDFWCSLTYSKDSFKSCTKEDLFFKVFQNGFIGIGWWLDVFVITVLKIREIRATKIESWSLLGKKHYQGAKEGWMMGLKQNKYTRHGTRQDALEGVEVISGHYWEAVSFLKGLGDYGRLLMHWKGNCHTRLQKGQEEWCRKQQGGWSPLGLL